MKRLFSLSAALLLTLSACAGPGGAAASPSPSLIPSPTPQITAQWGETTYTDDTVDEASGTTLMTVAFSLPHIISPEMTAAWEAINDYYQAELEPLQSSAEDTAAAAKEDFSYSGQFDASFHTYATEESYALKLNTPQYASLLRTYYIYTGGAHGEVYLTGDTFDMTTGTRLELDDLFTVPREAYMSRLMEEVKRQIAERAESESWPEWSEGGVWTEDDVTGAFDSAWFYLTPDGLTLYYQVYSLGPHALGSPEFPIAKEVLEDILISW